MIYFDNGATTITKPPRVAEAVCYAIDHFGNAGRSFYDAAMAANREIYRTRMEIAALIGICEPLSVAFTSSATESLNLVIGGLIKKEDTVATTVLEHNSVLRPLYLSGCRLRIIDCDDGGGIREDALDAILTPNVRFLVCTHGSNVLGNVTDAKSLRALCKARGVTMILDISQTFGTIPVEADMADIFCFTGHKGLFGPQGTGGIVTNGAFDFDIVKTGGAGVHSFARFQSKEMPDLFETGTPNSHGIYGLQKGVQFVRSLGVTNIHEKEMRLLRMFYEGIKPLDSVQIYGDFNSDNRLPILSLNAGKLPSSELARLLYEEYGIATRAGSHCAPLLHQRLGTVTRGMVRFSFSYFNTEDEVRKGIEAMREIAASLG